MSALARAKGRGFFVLVADVEAHVAECPTCPPSPREVVDDAIMTDGVHLAALDEERLHAFVSRIGLRRSWFQTIGVRGKPCHPHYDLISTAKFHDAVRAGARYVHYRDFSDWRKRLFPVSGAAK